MSAHPTKISGVGPSGSNRNQKINDQFSNAHSLSDGPPPEEDQRIEARVQQIGQQIFESVRGQKAGIWNKSFWQTQMMEWTTRNPVVKTQLFRFVDVLPVLKTVASKRDHLLEYLSRPNGQKSGSWPFFLSATTALLKTPFQSLVTSVADRQVKEMAANFILGKRVEEVLPKVEALRKEEVAFTLDLLGEAILSEPEAAEYRDLYHHLLDGLGERSKAWGPVSAIDDSPLGAIPKVNLSIKISALDAMPDPIAWEPTLARLHERLAPLIEKAMKYEIFINFDMEQFSYREMTNELFRRILMDDRFKNYRHLGIVVQAYLKTAPADVSAWVEFAKQRKTPFTVRLVKGAYWDYEQVIAQQNGWEPPVFDHKWQSDVAFEKCAKILLEGYPHLELAAGSHNVRSLAYCLAKTEDLGLPKNAMEVQMLYGMSGGFRKAFVSQGYRFREYCPVGEMLPGLSYLVRRLLENTANDSFLKQSFLDKKGVLELLKNPSGGWMTPEVKNQGDGL